MVSSPFISCSETKNWIILFCSVSKDNHGDEDVRILTDSEDDSLIVVHEEEEERKDEVNIAGEQRTLANQEDTSKSESTDSV